MNIAMNMIGLVLIILMKFDFGYRIKRIKNKQDKLFSYILLTSATLLIGNSIGWWLEGNPDPKLYILHYFIIFIVFIAQPLFDIAWMFYCLEILGYSYKLKKDWKQITALFLPIMIITIICLFSYKSPIFFNLDELGRYNRGTYHNIYVLLSFSYVAYAIIRAFLAYKKRIELEKFISLLLQPTIPMLAAFIQLYNVDLNLIYVSTSITSLIVYFNFQNVMITTDPLTGLNNRTRFDSYLPNRLEYLHDNQILFLMMIDINRFKSINDTFGHIEGDIALKSLAKIILQSISKHDFACRIGGDEFIVVGSRESLTEIENCKDNIKYNTNNYNETNEKKYDLSLSIGYSTTMKKEMKTIKSLLLEADKNMYDEKNYYKEQEKDYKNRKIKLKI